MPNDLIDFTELYTKPLNDKIFEGIPILPANKHFYGVILGFEVGQFSPKPDGRPGNQYIQVNVRPTDPGEDVSPEDIDGIDLNEIEVNRKFNVTKAALKYLREFLTTLNFAETAPLGECLTEMRGLRVLFAGSHTENKRGGQPFYNVDSIVGA